MRIGERTLVNTVDSHAAIAPVVKVYPNPSDGRVTVSQAQLEYDHLQVFDAYGRIVWSSKLTTVTADLKIVTKGIYILIFSNSSGTTVDREIRKVVIR